MEQTHSFNLVTGVPATIIGMTGRHRKILTQQQGKSFDKRLLSLLMDVTKTVGGVDVESMKESEKEEFFKSMFSADRKKLLTELRMYTYDFEPEFVFVHEYIGMDGATHSVEHTEDLSNGFPEQPFYEPDWHTICNMSYRQILALTPATKESKEDDAPLIMQPISCANYDEVRKYQYMYCYLPKTKRYIRMRRLDGIGEAIGNAANKADRDMNLAILMRTPCYIDSLENPGTPITLTRRNIEDMPVSDLDTMQAVITMFEGNIHTECMFEIPEDKPAADLGRTVVTDLLAQEHFFFPASR